MSGERVARKGLIKRDSLPSALIYLYIFSFLGGLAGYAVRILFARNLNPSDYGLFYAVFSFFSLIAIIRDFGMTESALFYGMKYYVKKAYSKMRGVFFYNQLLQTGLAILLSFIVIGLRDFLGNKVFHHPMATTILLPMTLYFLIYTIALSYASFLKIYGKYTLSALFNQIYIFFVLLLSIFFIYKGFDLMTASYSYLYTAVLLTLLYTIIFHVNDKQIERGISIDKKIFKNMILYAIPVIITSAGALLLTFSDTLMLSIMKGPYYVALYQIARPLSKVIVSLYIPAASIFLPLSSYYFHKNDIESIRKYFNILLLLSLTLAIPFTTIIFAFSKEVITLFFGLRYASAANTLRVLSIFVVITLLGVFPNSLLIASGRVKKRAKIFLIGAITNIVLDILLIYRFYATGAAIASLLSYFIIMMMAYYHTLDILKINKHLIRKVLLILLSGILTLIPLFIIRVFDFNMYLKVIIGAILSFSLYILLIILFRIIGRSEIELIIKEVSKRSRKVGELLKKLSSFLPY